MKALYYGIGVATLSGLLIGGVLRPTLVEGRIGGPQIALGDTVRAAYADTDQGPPIYPQSLPDYVVGTDNLYPPMDFSAYRQADIETAWREAAPDLPIVEPASYWLAAPEPALVAPPVHYPTQGGGILAGLERDQAPADLGPEVFEPADAPPAAMAAFQRDDAAASGDTSRADPSSGS